MREWRLPEPKRIAATGHARVRPGSLSDQDALALFGPCEDPCVVRDDGRRRLKRVLDLLLDPGRVQCRFGGSLLADGRSGQ